MVARQDSSRTQCRGSVLLFVLLAALVAGCSGDKGDQGDPGPEGPAGPAGPPGEDGGMPATAVEGCLGCHGAGGVLPVGDITMIANAHYVDTDPNGPLVPFNPDAPDVGYRQVNATITSVDVTGMSVIIAFSAVDELGAAVANLFADDGRFAIVRLEAALNGDPSEWIGIGSRDTEQFTSGTFENLGGGAYRYTSAYDPTGIVMSADTLRVAIELSASDLPAENAWCDFDANLAAPNNCVSGTTLTRDIVQTADCNVCHGPTSETQLAFHRNGGRTDVEYCVTCHNPMGRTDMTLLIHKIHAGSQLANGFRGYSNVDFTKDLDDCATCHTGGGVDVDNWKTQPNRDACGSCHDAVNFDTGENHGAGGVQMTNTFCANCHPAVGPRTAASLPVATVHLGAARMAEAATYRGLMDGYAIEVLSYDAATDTITVDYSVSKSGSRMDLETAPEWTSGGSLSLRVGWDTAEYTNEGSGSTPAQPASVNALDIGGAVSAIGGGVYRAAIPRPSAASNTVTVHMDGRPVADLEGDGSFGDRIPIASVIAPIDVEGGRSTPMPRRSTVDPTLCNVCHDSGGAGLAIHGTNRVNETQVCAVCHNPDATDINRRPADPSTTPDMKREEAIDFKRMVHQIHTGKDLQNGLVIYGFGGTPHDYSDVSFIGNSQNCETCHLVGTYSTEKAANTLASTIDTGADIEDPLDDLNISPQAAVCASCHDDDVAKDHMELNGASFSALDADIR